MKKRTKTNLTHIIRALRQVWLHSPERAMALKRDKYTCQICGKKQSNAKGKEHKVIVHHLIPCGEVKELKDFGQFIERLFCHPDYLMTVCSSTYGDCHKNAPIYKNTDNYLLQKTKKQTRLVR